MTLLICSLNLFLSRIVKQPQSKMKKIIVLPVMKLSDFERRREKNIEERLALLKELGFCKDDENLIKPRKKRIKKAPKMFVLRKSDRLKKEKS